jgi:hypothetical protein
VIKRLIIAALFLSNSFTAIAQTNSDSLAYQLQRKKINNMLAQRSIKFGQYDQSLSKHTGIFGLQTKKDIRNSNDILMNIVKTDDDIYKELKILLDFSIFQRSQVQSHSKEAEQSNMGFMITINKLRNQVDSLKADAEKQQQQYEKNKLRFVILLILMFALTLLLLIRKSRRKT